MAVAKTSKKVVRRSISLRSEVDSKVQKIARGQNRSTNQVLESLIESGLAAKEAERKRFFELADRLQNSNDAAEIARLREELARLTFGS